MSAEEPARPKSILKNSIPSTHASSLSSATSPPPTPQRNTTSTSQRPKTKTRATTNPSKTVPDSRHLAIALHHANQIQSRKDTEILILNHILDLISLPSNPDANPASPSTSDAAHLKTSLVPFQPADYDNLILERNIEGRCGYALCPREHRKEDPKAKFRILWGPKGSGANGRGREMKVVPREKLEMWCSDECAERAMYVRVQLAERPVWERRADDADIMAENILLLEEAKEQKRQGRSNERKLKAAQRTSDLDGDSSKAMVEGTCADPDSIDVVDKMDRLTVTDEQSPPPTSEDKARDLALERGDSTPAFRQQGRINVQIMEKNTVASATSISAPVPSKENQQGGTIEGYVPKHKSNQKYDRSKSHNDYEDDEDDLLDVI
jgi:hypothetical protein